MQLSIESFLAPLSEGEPSLRSHAGQNVLADLVGGAHGGAELLDVRFDGGMDLLGRHPLRRHAARASRL